MPPELPPIPGYTLTGRAGQGGMGTVYKAEQISPRRSVAIKVLSGANVNAAQMLAFRREAEVVAHLEHPRIVPLYDFGEYAGAPYLVLRYLGGGSVADRLRSGPLDLATAARWIDSIADALDFAHKKGILHRDIKPSNMLLDDGGNAYLTDFGLASTLTEEARELTGSAAYMSPEQARGQPMDGRADIYSLAVTFFEMLTGQKPYTAETALGMVVRHVNDPIPSARAIQPAIPPSVDELIQWGMAKSPADRPQSALEFALWLRQARAHPQAPLRASAVVQQPTVVAEPGPAAIPARKGLSPLIWIGAVVVLVACIVGGLVTGGGLIAAALYSATPTIAATATPLPVPTVARPGPSPTPEGILLTDDFANPSSGFAVSSDPDGGVSYDNRKLKFTVNRTGVDWFSPSRRVQAANVDIQVDILQVSGPTKSQWALICRWQDASNYTALALNGDGQYAIWQEHGGGKPKYLQDWKPVPELSSNAGATHRVEAVCAEKTLSLKVDGKLLGSAQDPNPLAGDVALMAGSRAAGPTVVVVFSNLIVTQP